MRARTARQSAVAEAEVKAEAKVETEPEAKGNPELIEATVVAEIEQKLPPTNFLVIGNPGVGKSTLLNGLVASLFGGSDVYFESGVSFGSGLTYAFDEKKVGRHTFMDTPGLSDTMKRQQAADAITEALKCGGHYKVVFVVTLENGRVRADDLTTMRLVLDAAPITNYGIIVNQVQPKILDRLLGRSSKKDEKRLQEILLHLLVSLEGKMTPAIHAVERDSDLEGEDNIVKPLGQDTLEFMCSLPGMEIEPERVNPVMGEEFDKMRDNLKSNMESVSKEVAKAGGMTMGLGTILAAVLEGEALAAACLTATVSGGTLLGLGVLGAMYAPYLAKMLVKEPEREEKEDQKDSEGVNEKAADVEDEEASEEAEKLEREVADFMALELNIDRSKVQEAMPLKDLGVEERALVKAVWDRFKVRIEESEAATRTLKDFVRDVVKELKGQMASILSKS